VVNRFRQYAPYFTPPVINLVFAYASDFHKLP
jgi:hypothetical protein